MASRARRENLACLVSVAHQVTHSMVCLDLLASLAYLDPRVMMGEMALQADLGHLALKEIKVVHATLAALERKERRETEGSMGHLDHLGTEAHLDYRGQWENLETMGFLDHQDELDLQAQQEVQAVMGSQG